MEPSKECDYCGQDLSKMSEVFEVQMRSDTASRRYRYCSGECTDNHQDTRMRELEKTNDD